MWSVMTMSDKCKQSDSRGILFCSHQVTKILIKRLFWRFLGSSDIGMDFTSILGASSNNPTQSYPNYKEFFQTISPIFAFHRCPNEVTFRWHLNIGLKMGKGDLYIVEWLIDTITIQI